MECVSRDQLGPASSVLAPFSAGAAGVGVCVCLMYVCDGRELVMPANDSHEMAEVGIHAAELLLLSYFSFCSVFEKVHLRIAAHQFVDVVHISISELRL